VDVVGRTARAAARRIEAGALNNGGSLETLAREFRLSSRQLRRAFQQEFGVSPVELAQTQRLLLAKQLLTESGLSMIEIAFASGFESVRRFNASFRDHYRLTPSRMRRSIGSGRGDDSVQLTLAYRPPLAWGALIGFLAKRATAGIESVSHGAYSRTVSIGCHRGWVRVERARGRNALSVAVATSLTPALPELLSRLKNLFDLGARPDVIEGHLVVDPRLARIVERSPGLRVPGAFDGFELAIRAILGQRIAVRAATTLAGRLAERFGEPVETPSPELNRLCPTPERIIEALPAELTALGIAPAQVAAIQAVARAINTREINLEAGADPDLVIAQLRELPGIGDWTAHYVAMRALRWPDAFPTADLGLLKAWGTSSPRSLNSAAKAWQPWRAYAAMYLWESSNLATQETLT
jgi:AraC family transcriptional regulator of adaptative response / DNA-3-methyladenine glycosylase II